MRKSDSKIWEGLTPKKGKDWQEKMGRADPKNWNDWTPLKMGITDSKNEKDWLGKVRWIDLKSEKD